MKVLMAANINSAHTRKWITALSSEGLELLVFSLTPPSDGDYRTPAGVRLFDAGLSPAVHGNDSSLKKSRYVFALGKLRKLLRQEKPDILHAHYASSYGFLAALSGFHPLVVSVWGSDVFEFPLDSILRRKIIRHTFRKADRILSTSHIMAVEIEKYSGKEITITPFGIDIRHFAPQAGKAGIVREGFVLGMVKSLEKVYGQETLLEAMALLKKDEPALVLRAVLTGTGSEESKLKQKCRQLGLEGSVEFTGWVSPADLPDVFNSMDIFVNASLSESFGVSVLEASACGLPVIASDTGGLPEVLVNGETGLLFPAGDVKALAEKIRVLSGDSSMRQRMGENGRKMVTERYELGICVQKMVNVYRSLL